MNHSQLIIILMKKIINAINPIINNINLQTFNNLDNNNIRDIKSIIKYSEFYLINKNNILLQMLLNNIRNSNIENTFEYF